MRRPASAPGYREVPKHQTSSKAQEEADYGARYHDPRRDDDRHRPRRPNPRLIRGQHLAHLSGQLRIPTRRLPQQPLQHLALDLQRVQEQLLD